MLSDLKYADKYAENTDISELETSHTLCLFPVHVGANPIPIPVNTRARDSHVRTTGAHPLKLKEKRGELEQS